MRKTRIANFLMVVISSLAALVLFDLVLMPFNLVFNSAIISEFNFEDPTEKQLRSFSRDSFASWSQSDSELGYLPRMGEKFAYSNMGTRHNDYGLEKPQGGRRILMLGDSITAIGNLGQALQKLLSPQKNQIWNAGVYGYSTFQEVIFFERFASKVKPDLIILEFCLNDFDGTPVIIKSGVEKTLVAKMYLGSDHFNAWLFQYSTIYRVWLSIKKSLFDRPGLVEDVKLHLARLRKKGREDDFKLLVVVYPLFVEPADWPKSYKRQHADALAVLKELGIRHYDALPLFGRMVDAHGLAYTQQKKGDIFHPSMSFSSALAKDLVSQGLLD